jgi:cytochrome b pre-mRNA-processing protein 3
MIMLHAVLVLDRLQDDTTDARELGQGLFDRFCRDMDDNMREMGVGDLAVPRKMRRIGEAFYGRQATYGAALAAADDEAMIAALARNVFPVGSKQDGAARLAAYSRRAFEQLEAQDGFERGDIFFPDPEQVALHE